MNQEAPEFTFDTETLLAEYAQQLEELQALGTNWKKLRDKDKDFALSLLQGFSLSNSLSPRQWAWIRTLNHRVTGAHEITGSFAPILVMFRLAASNGDLKRPKIRLLTSNDRFVLCSFNPERTRAFEVFVDGWAGHGVRKFAGWVEENKIIPYNAERMSPDVVEVLQELARDPQQCVKAMAARLGVCSFCGSHLTDEPSKVAGYGPICAQNYHLPWGDRSNAKVELPPLFDDL